MSEFESVSTLEVMVSDSSLRSARGKIEDELGGITVGVQASGGGGVGAVAGQRGRGSGSLIGDGAGVGTLDVMMDQLEVLEDMHDTLKKLGQGGGGGGGGDGGGGGVLASIGGGVVGRSLLGAAGGGGLTAGISSVVGGTAATIAGGVVGGTALGLGGVAALDRTGALGGLRNAGQQLGSMAGGQRTQSALQTTNMLTGGYFGSIVESGAMATDLVRGNGLRGPLTRQADRMFTTPNDIADRALSGNLKQPQWAKNFSLQKPNWLTTLTGGPKKPQWLSSLTGGPDKPQWLSSLTGGPDKPQWLSTLTNGPDKPDWIPKLDTAIGVETPDWVNNLDSKLDLTIDIPSPTLDLTSQSIQREVEDAFDSFEDEIVDKVVSRIKGQFDIKSPL
jgi:hypothetical protein